MRQRVVRPIPARFQATNARVEKRFQGARREASGLKRVCV